MAGRTIRLGCTCNHPTHGRIYDEDKKQCLIHSEFNLNLPISQQDYNDVLHLLNLSVGKGNAKYFSKHSFRRTRAIAAELKRLNSGLGAYLIDSRTLRFFGWSSNRTFESYVPDATQFYIEDIMPFEAELLNPLYSVEVTKSISNSLSSSLSSSSETSSSSSSCSSTDLSERL